MKYNDLSILLLKISGLLIFIISMINLPNYFVNYYSLQNFYDNQVSDFFTILVSVAIPLAITILISFVLLIFPKSLTNAFVLKTTDKSEINLESIPSVVFMGLGMYILAFALADAVYWVSHFSFIQRGIPGAEYLTLENKARFVATVAEILIGLGLLLGAKGINNIVLKLRNSG